MTDDYRNEVDMLRLSYVVRRDSAWAYGKTWVLYALEGGEIEFITDWMQEVAYAD